MYLQGFTVEAQPVGPSLWIRLSNRHLTCVSYRCWLEPLGQLILNPMFCLFFFHVTPPFLPSSRFSSLISTLCSVYFRKSIFHPFHSRQATLNRLLQVCLLPFSCIQPLTHFSAFPQSSGHSGYEVSAMLCHENTRPPTLCSAVQRPTQGEQQETPSRNSILHLCPNQGTFPCWLSLLFFISIHSNKQHFKAHVQYVLRATVAALHVQIYDTGN